MIAGSIAMLTITLATFTQAVIHSTPEQLVTMARKMPATAKAN